MKTKNHKIFGLLKSCSELFENVLLKKSPFSNDSDRKLVHVGHGFNEKSLNTMLDTFPKKIILKFIICTIPELP